MNELSWAELGIAALVLILVFERFIPSLFKFMKGRNGITLEKRLSTLEVDVCWIKEECKEIKEEIKKISG